MERKDGKRFYLVFFKKGTHLKKRRTYLGRHSLLKIDEIRTPHIHASAHNKGSTEL